LKLNESFFSTPQLKRNPLDGSAGGRMGLFGKNVPEQVQVAGLHLHCEVCKHDQFWQREAQLNTAVATFFNLDWANTTAICYVCDGCGYIHWFLPQR
jgi:hypothetical protein